MSGGGPFGQTELLVTIGYRLVQEQHLYGVAAAFAIFQFFILLAITLATNKLAHATAVVRRMTAMTPFPSIRPSVQGSREP